MKKSPPLRVYHGPVNIGGIGGFLAKYERAVGIDSKFITWWDIGNQQNHDHNLKLNEVSRWKWPFRMLLHFFKSLFKYDIFHFYYGTSLIPLGLDLPVIKIFGKKIIMTYVGSEVRLVNLVERKRNPYHYLLRVGRDHPKHDWKKVIMLIWHNIWIDKFIAPRALYRDARYIIPSKKIIKDVWIHNISIGPLKKKILNESVKTNNIPLLVHAPTNKGIKGTKYIEEAIAKLKGRGLKFKYKRIEKIPNSEAQELYRNSDIIIDQILLGGYGSLAVEGMYFGKAVICNICDDVLNTLDNCPIYNANINDIEVKLLELITNKELRIELGKKGKEYVAKHHNFIDICNRMCNIYRELNA